MTITDYVPHWLAWPVSLLSALSALTGSAMIFAAAALGEYGWAVWAAITFAAAGALWYLADIAATNRPMG